MPGKNDIVAGIRLDGEKEFRESITGINKNLSAMKAELNKTNAEYEGQANSLEALTKKDEILNRILEEQKKKASKTRAALDHASEGYKNAGKKVAALREEYDAQKEKLDSLEEAYQEAEKKLQAMTDGGNDSEEAMQRQRDAVEGLRQELEKQNSALNEAEADLGRGEAAYNKIGNKVQDWKTKLSTAETQVIKATRAVNENAAYMEEAEQATDQCATSIDKFGKKMEGAGEVTTGFGEKLRNAITMKGTSMAADALKEGAEKIKEAMYDISSATADLGAQTGAAGEKLEGYKDIMLAIRGNNFGQDYADISEAMGKVVQTMGDLDDAELQNVTESAITLRDAFGMDYQESLRAVKMLMDQFGISSGEAFDLIVQGTQQGLDKNGDLLDTINEYSVHYSQMGVSADGFFNSLKNGTDAGTFSVDKLGDAYKEFGIRVKDTATTTDEAYGILGLDADEMREKFAAGGQSASDAAGEVLAALFSLDDQVAQNQAGVDLFGTMWEDLGVSGVKALTNLEGEAGEAKGAMESLKDVKYSDLESAVSGLGAAVQENVVTPIADKALPAITEGINKATEAVQAIGEKISPQKTVLQEFIDGINASNDEVNGLLADIKEGMSGAEADVSGLEEYRQALVDLNSVEEKTEYQKYQVKKIVGELSGSIPELAAAFDEETGSIRLTNEEIEGLIGNQEALIMQKAAAEAQEQSYKALFDAELNAAKAASAVQQAEEDIARYYKENEDLASDLANGWLVYDDGLSELQATLNGAQKAQEEADRTLEEAQGVAEETGRAIDAVTEKYGAASEAAEENSSAADTNAARQEQLARRSREAAESAGELAGAMEEGADASEDAADAARKAAKAMEDAYGSAFRSVKDAYDAAKEELSKGLSIDFTSEEFGGGIDLSVEEMLRNSETQLEGLRNYEENLAEVRDHVGEEIAPEFLEYLEGLGTEGANILEHISRTFEQDGGNDKVRQWSDNYVEAMDIQDRISDTLANDSMALFHGLEELGSTEADFSALRDSIDAAADSAAEGWGGITDATRQKLEEAVQAAQDMGIQIPEGLAAGIEDGGTSPESAIAQLQAAMDGQLDALAEIAREQGITVPESLSEGIEGGGQATVDAYNALVEKLRGQASDAREAGKEIGSESTAGMQSSIEDGTSGVEQSAGAMAQAGAEATGSREGEYKNAGEQAASAYASGIGGGMQEASRQAAQMAAQALSGVNAYRQSFRTAGLNMAAGTAEGIRAGRAGAVQAAAQMAAQALAAAKKELGINSPSKKFRSEVGQQIGKGMAFGIRDRSALAGKEAEKMSQKVYKNATGWLSKYKKSQEVTLSEERYFWEQVQKTTKKGSEAYAKAAAKAEAAKKAQSGINAQVRGNFGVSRTTTTGSGKNQKTVKKDTETYYSEIYTAAAKYLQNMETLYNFSLEEEKEYWER